MPWQIQFVFLFKGLEFKKEPHSFYIYIGEFPL